MSILKKSKYCKWYNVCPMKRYYLQGILSESWIKEFCMKDWQKCIRYKMEEKGEYHPDNMLPNGNIDKSLK